MNRKDFLAAIAAMISAPFIKIEEQPNTLPTHRSVEVADVEDFVRKEIDRRLKVTIKGEDLVRVLKRCQH